MQPVLIELFYPTCCLFSSHIKCALGSQEDPFHSPRLWGLIPVATSFLLSPRARPEISAKIILNHSIHRSSLLMFFKTIGHSRRKFQDCSL